MSSGGDVDDARDVLRKLLIKEYDSIARRLVRRVGSIEAARDVLQETFLRLERASDIRPMRDPRSYLFRMALNVATDIERSENRKLTRAEVDDLLAVPDDRPDPARHAEDRSELMLLQRALAELPLRRREIFTEARVLGTPNPELAARYGVTVRTIELEIKNALDHCAKWLQRPKE